MDSLDFKKHLYQQKQVTLPFQILKMNRKLVLIECIKFLYDHFIIAKFQFLYAIGTFAHCVTNVDGRIMLIL